MEKLIFLSYENLVRHYKGKGISGIMPLGTTGESPSVSEREAERIIEITMEVIDSELPVFVGPGGNDTENTVKRLKMVEKYKVDGILASSHMNTEVYAEIFDLLKKNDHQGALVKRRAIEEVASLLFNEPNPAPLKYCLEKLNLINSLELRLPMTGISGALQKELDELMGR